MNFLSKASEVYKKASVRREEPKDCTIAVAKKPSSAYWLPDAFSPSDQQQPGFLPPSSMQVATCSLLNTFVVAMFFAPVLADFLRPDITST